MIIIVQVIIGNKPLMSKSSKYMDQVSDWSSKIYRENCYLKNVQTLQMFKFI